MSISITESVDYTFPSMNTSIRPSKWTPLDIIALLCQPGRFPTSDWRGVEFGATIFYESDQGDPLAQGKRIWKPGTPVHLSVDLGLFQLNSYYATVTGHYPDTHPISESDCFDPFAAFDYVWLLLNKERPDGWHYNLKPWHAYTGGYYDQYLARFHEARNEYRVNFLGLPAI